MLPDPEAITSICPVPITTLTEPNASAADKVAPALPTPE